MACAELCPTILLTVCLVCLPAHRCAEFQSDDLSGHVSDGAGHVPDWSGHPAADMSSHVTVASGQISLNSGQHSGEFDTQQYTSSRCDRSLSMDQCQRTQYYGSFIDKWYCSDTDMFVSTNSPSFVKLLHSDLFCIVYDNLLYRERFQLAKPILSHEVFESTLMRSEDFGLSRGAHASERTRSKPSTQPSSSVYSYGDTIYTVQRGSLQPLGLLSSSSVSFTICDSLTPVLFGRTLHQQCHIRLDRKRDYSRDLNITRHVLDMCVLRTNLQPRLTRGAPLYDQVPHTCPGHAPAAARSSDESSHFAPVTVYWCAQISADSRRCSDQDSAFFSLNSTHAINAVVALDLRIFHKEGTILQVDMNITTADLAFDTYAHVTRTVMFIPQHTVEESSNYLKFRIPSLDGDSYTSNLFLVPQLNSNGNCVYNQKPIVVGIDYMVTCHIPQELMNCSSDAEITETKLRRLLFEYLDKSDNIQLSTVRHEDVWVTLLEKREAEFSGGRPLCGDGQWRLFARWHILLSRAERRPLGARVSIELKHVRDIFDGTHPADMTVFVMFSHVSPTSGESPFIQYYSPPKLSLSIPDDFFYPFTFMHNVSPISVTSYSLHFTCVCLLFLLSFI